MIKGLSQAKGLLESPQCNLTIVLLLNMCGVALGDSCMTHVTVHCVTPLQSLGSEDCHSGH